jgi:glutaredoxin-related protein
VFIKGQFYGDTDILGPMAHSGELTKVLDAAFAGSGATPAIKLT